MRSEMAYKATKDDLEFILKSHWDAVINPQAWPLSDFAFVLWERMDKQKIEKAVLYGSDQNSQTLYAIDEMSSQLCLMGVLDQARMGQPQPAPCDEENVLVLNVQLRLARKAPPFLDEAHALRWVTRALNANANHVTATAVPLPPSVPIDVAEPVVVVDIDGGLVQNIRSDAPVRVIVLDSDVEGCSEGDVEVIEGSEVYASIWDPDVLPLEVSAITAELEDGSDPERPHQ